MVDSAIEAFTYALDLDNTDAASWYNLGALHRRNGHEDSAVACYDAALGLRPDYTKAAAALAEIHTSNGALPAAIDAWRSLLTHQPDHDGGITFAEILIAIGEGEGEVLEMATEIPTTIPEGPELASEALKYIPDDGDSTNVILKARALTLTGSYPEAVKAWRALIETDRDNSDLWKGMMKTFVAAGDQTTAEKCRQKIASLSGETQSISDANAALSADPTEPEDVVVDEPEPEPAPVESVEESEPESEPEMEVVEDDPWGDDPWADVSESTTEQAEVSSEETTTTPAEIIAAEATLDTVPEPEPIPQDEPSPEVDLAKVALDTQSQSTSQSEIIGAGKIDSSSIANQDVQWYNKGLSLLADEKYEEALSCFDRALPTFVNDDEMIVRILNARGNAFYYLKQFSECIDAYHKAMQVNPAGVTGATLYNMGTAYAEVERYDDGIKCFEQGMSPKRVNPLTGEQSKMAKEQIRRCKILQKEQQKKLKRYAKLQN
jgi:tetratricopeptide (TPR) repeat protein